MTASEVAVLTLKVVPFYSDWPTDLCDEETCATFPVCRMQNKIEDFYKAVDGLLAGEGREDANDYYVCVVGCKWFSPLKDKSDDNH